ncbi:MAG TPA: hypothetical protein VNO21_04180 [Polyangiaceae bacterium]|nr:hypothetical protein [Polyangiaceae bacterium]
MGAARSEPPQGTVVAATKDVLAWVHAPTHIANSIAAPVRLKGARSCGGQ